MSAIHRADWNQVRILELRRRTSSLRVIAISGGGRVSSADYLHMARKLGAVATLEKPFERDQLKSVLEELRLSAR